MNRIPGLHRRRLFLLGGAALLSGCGGGGDSGGDAAAPSPAAPPPSQPPAPAGAIERIAIRSQALGRALPAAVYLPPGYDATLRYPVLYLFYGYGGNEHSFFDGGLALNRAADGLIAAGAIAPPIIVVPNYANSFGVNSSAAQAPDSAGGSIGPYEDYLIGELLPAVEARYAIDATRARRHIGGVSMGGFAALHLALRHPGLFTRVGAHSAALWDYSEADQFRAQRNWLYPTRALRAERDPLLLASRTDLRGLRFYLDVGTRDGLRAQDEAMHAVLQERGAASAFHLAEGGHDATFWRGRMEDWLRFYAGR